MQPVCHKYARKVIFGMLQPLVWSPCLEIIRKITTLATQKLNEPSEAALNDTNFNSTKVLLLAGRLVIKVCISQKSATATAFRLVLFVLVQN